MALIGMYARHAGGARIVRADAEEDAFRDVLTLMTLLTNILSKDLIDFGEPDENEADGKSGVSAANVALFGLNIIVPLVSAELLKFPALCSAYYRVVAYVGEIYPEKVSTQRSGAGGWVQGGGTRTSSVLRKYLDGFLSLSLSLSLSLHTDSLSATYSHTHTYTHTSSERFLCQTAGRFSSASHTKINLCGGKVKIVSQLTFYDAEITRFSKHTHAHTHH